MTARIFISYRTADGMDKATALARDLGARFGDDQVFLDKDDLRGGSSWRDEVQRALGARPVLLLLLTPQFFAATDARGALRIDDPADPVRREFETALEAGAHVIPVCCDGVEAPPPDLAPPFDRIRDHTWRRLRAYDWRHDIERLTADLVSLGVEPIGARGSLPRGTTTGASPADGGAAPGDDTRRRSAPTSRSPAARRAAITVSVVLAMLAAAVAGYRIWSWRAPAATAPETATAARPGIPGTWIASVAAEPPFALTLQQRDERVAMTSEPMPVAGRAGWEGYRAFWLRLTGTELRDVVFRGQGTVQTDPGTPLTIDIAWKLYNGAGDTQIDSGNLHAIAAPDGSLRGTLWSNGDQADKPLVLKRPR